MKLCFILTIFLVTLFQAKSQNLVPNWSFETITPITASGHITDAVHWLSASTASPDVFNVNAALSAFVVLVPHNYFGDQQPRTGQGYAGIATISDLDYSEYLEVELLTPLQKGKTYCVSFYVSRSDVAVYANSDVGAYFSLNRLYRPSNKPIDDVVPQVLNPPSAMLTNSEDWVLVSGSFKAAGGEKFMTLGTFQSMQNSNHQIVPGGVVQYAAYYVDDVSVYECQEPPQVSNDEASGIVVPNVFTPNNDGINDVFIIHAEDIKYLNCIIYNRWGMRVAELTNAIYYWDGNKGDKACEDGIYFYTLEATGYDGVEHRQKGSISLFR